MNNELESTVNGNRLRYFDDEKGDLCFDTLRTDNAVVNGINPSASSRSRNKEQKAFDCTSLDSHQLFEHFLMMDDLPGESADELSLTSLEQGRPRMAKSQKVSKSSITSDDDRDATNEEKPLSNQTNSKSTALTTSASAMDISVIGRDTSGHLASAATSSSTVKFGTTAAEGCFDVAYINSLRESPTPFDLPAYKHRNNLKSTASIGRSKTTSNAPIARTMEYEKMLHKPKAIRKKPPPSKPKNAGTTRPVSMQSKSSSDMSQRHASNYAVNETKHQTWKPFEDDMLKEALSAVEPRWFHGSSGSRQIDFETVTQKFVELGGNRSVSQCKTRYPKLVFKQGKWDKHEDDFIREQVKELGTGKWATIAKALPSRRSDSIRDRWVNHLDPRIVKSPMDELETKLLFQWVSILGNEWSTIAALMYVFRTPNQCKNRYNNQTKAIQIKRQREQATSQISQPKKKIKATKKSREIKKEPPVSAPLSANHSRTVNIGTSIGAIQDTTCSTSSYKKEIFEV